MKRVEERLGVIADDLTGANDTGVQFKKQGFETIVLFGDGDLTQPIEDIDVTVVDTESRSVTSDVAYQKVREAVKLLDASSISVVYKKIDSTLRGNIGIELDAVMKEADMSLSIVAPAFPTYGRVTINGCQLVNGVPVGKTEFFKDHLNPLISSHVPTLIKAQVRRKVGQIDLSTVKQGVKALQKAIAKENDKGVTVIVIDAVEENDLDTIGHVSLSLNALSCGSAGLANAISKILGHRRRRPVLIASGSARGATLNQIKTAKEASISDVVDLDSSKLLRNDYVREKEELRAIEEIKNLLRQGSSVILSTTKSGRDVSSTLERGIGMGLTASEVRVSVSSAVGEIVRTVIQSEEVAGLVLTGGDTAMSCIHKLKAEGVRIVKEILPGIPLCRLIGGESEGLRTVTKAGGFGEEEALIEIIQFLKESF